MGVEIKVRKARIKSEVEVEVTVRPAHPAIVGKVKRILEDEGYFHSMLGVGIADQQVILIHGPAEVKDVKQVLAKWKHSRR